ncbi:sialate:O-sulfotransferase 2-like [Apostichopus japonicus]|uniref:sialate:O-sulfotransferase 2-like n=1 Tax=Stichopus japonicus TaxID=307972 RepID=UPI003AB8B6C9
MVFRIHTKMKTWMQYSCVFILLVVVLLTKMIHSPIIKIPWRSKNHEQDQFHDIYTQRSQENYTLLTESSYDKAVPNNNIVDVDVEWYLADADKFDPERECPLSIEKEQLTIPTERFLIALASFPRSGNRFTRQNIYKVTLQNKQAYNEVHGLDINDTEPDRICYKTHSHGLKYIKFYTGGAILLLRNPRDAVVSYFFFTYSDTGQHDKETVKQWIRTNDTIWTNFTGRALLKWRQTNLHWINYGHRVMISYTEDIRKNAVRELARMIIFVGQMVPLDFLQCTLFTFPWISRKHLDFEPPLPEGLMKRYIDEVNNTLLSKGARPLPTYPSTYL